jgi:hypothetical protein
MHLPERVISMTEVLNEIANSDSRDKFMGMLTSGVCEVTFTKVNGDKRVMTCTLLESMIPSAEKDEPITQKKVRAVNPEVIPCWDTNAEGWRSFRVDSVQECKYVYRPKVYSM